MVMQNLAQLTQQIRDEYANSLSIVVPTEQISLTDDGLLSTAKNEFLLTREASEQFARLLKIPPSFYLTLESDLRTAFFNRRFSVKQAEGHMGRKLRLNLDGDRQIVGYDDPKLLQISPVALMDAVKSSLPKGLSTEQIKVSRLHIASNILSFSCYSPQIWNRPRVGDVINGGIDVHHSTSGEFGTQIRCYLRRQICSNGACTHICEDEQNVRARRLPNGKFDDKDMIAQICRLLEEAWGQITAKLQAVEELLNKKQVPSDFLRYERTKYSLSNRVLSSIEAAVKQDEIGPTSTQYDYFNAISRVATHDESLSLRQRRRLMFMAGEFSQQTAHRCDKCGSWVPHQS